ncbi:MAG: hypothetical protein QOG23_1048 [Blastocatellia bacterium]|nr:hypothetical protein [Blastocatellia bacterium]
MSLIRLYIDEDSQSHGFVRALRSRNVDVTTALESAMIERDDEAHLLLATSQGRVLYTFNVGDFYRLHTLLLSEGRSHAGIILAQNNRYSVGDQMRRVLKLTANRSGEEMIERVEFLSSWG